MKNLLILLLPFLLMAASAGAQARPAGKSGRRHQHSNIQYGIASYYANKFQGRPMASGILYDKNKMTCAHNSLPMGTWIKVTSMRNKKWVVVKVTDRLHHSNKRLVDLSGVAAGKLGFIKRGLTRVKVKILDRNVAAK